MTTPPAQLDAHIRLAMRSNPMYLAAARELVSALSRRLGFPEAAAAKIALAVDEALCNIMRHGYDRRTDAPIWISLWPLDAGPAQAAGLKIVIEDEARQVEPAQIRGRDLEDVRPGGLGVHIIREVMDEARYEKRADIGMRLTLVKYLKEDESRAKPASVDPGASCGAAAPSGGPAPGNTVPDASAHPLERKPKGAA